MQYEVLVQAFNPMKDCMPTEPSLLGDLSLPMVFTTGPPSVPIRPPAPALVGVTGGAIRVLLQWPLDYGGSPITSLDLRVDGVLKVSLTNPQWEHEFRVTGYVTRVSQ